MAEEGLSKRLEEIDMSASESKLYSGILDVRCRYNGCRVRPCALHTSIQRCLRPPFHALIPCARTQRVGREISQLRVVLQSAETRSKERQWLKHQTTGELDDAKLIDGVTGERLIYKRRGEEAPLAGAPPPEPRRLHFVLDVSGR